MRTKNMKLEKKEKERDFIIDYTFPDGSILKGESVTYKAKDFTFLNIDNGWFLTSDLSDRSNIEYYGALHKASIIYCKNVGVLTRDELEKKIGAEPLNKLIELQEITLKEDDKYLEIFLGDKTIYNSCVGTVKKKINAMGLRKELGRTPSAKDIMEYRKTNTPTTYNTPTIYKKDNDNNPFSNS